MTDVADVTVSPESSFEGQVVAGHEARIPSLTLAMGVGYRRGTHLRMIMDLRVRNVTMREDREGNLVRAHVFALEEAQLVAAFTSAEAAAASAVGGSLSASAAPSSDELAAKDERIARLEADLKLHREVLQELVTLKGGPRDAEYERRKPAAWADACDLLGVARVDGAHKDAFGGDDWSWSEEQTGT